MNAPIYGWAKVKITVKKATTDMDRVISLLDASITDPVALIAEAPHLHFLDIESFDELLCSEEQVDGNK